MSESNLTAEERVGVHCKECGMWVKIVTAYHPYAACLMFKQCGDREIVEANLNAVLEYERTHEPRAVHEREPPHCPTCECREAEVTAESDGMHYELLAKLPHVTPTMTAEVMSLSIEELRRRVLIQKDWLGSYSSCLDGLGLKIGVEKCRDPRDIRRIVESSAPTKEGSR